MKFLILMIALLLSFASFAVKTSPMSNQFDATGTIVKKDNVDIKVRCAEASSAGDLMTFDTTSDDGATVEQVDTLGEASACVLLKACAANADVYCRVYGYASVNYSAATAHATPGLPIFASGDALEGYVTGIATPSAHNWPVGIALDDATSTGSLEVFLQLM